MELLQYKYHNAYVIQASSTDIGMSWRKFKVRAKQQPPERYCNYVMASGGTLRVYNADSKVMNEVAEADWHEARPTVTLFAYRKYADLDRQERIYACCQHACLKYVTNDKMTNLTLRERLGIDKQNYPMASRIIRDTLVAGKIKDEKTENQSRNNKGYVPFWA